MKLAGWFAATLLAAVAAYPGGVLFARVATGTPPVAARANAHAISGVTCQTVDVPMRDGTLLSTDVYLPVKPGKYPVILERSPYGRTGGGCFVGYYEPGFAQFAKHGYAAAFQFVRGTFTSGGVFNPFVQEVNDEYDAVEWAAAQPWSTGRVGTTGDSYLAIDQWMGAIATPPHLYAINPDLADSDPHDNAGYENGVVRLSDGIQYANEFVPDSITRTGIAEGWSQAQIAQAIAAYQAFYAANLASFVNSVPLAALPLFEPYQETAFFYTWLNNPDYDAYWQAQDTEPAFGKVTVPALIGGASGDIFNIGEIRNYQGMRQAAGTPAARAGTKLYWQAYGHAGNSGTPTFGNDALPWSPTGGATILNNLQLAFFDYYLKGKSGYETAANVYLYVLVPPDSGETGSGFWLGAADFPLPSTKMTRYYLGSNGSANSRLGNGYLTTQAGAGGAASDGFTYDPSNPVPTVGGNLLLPDALRGTLGFQDQSTVELRNDVLVYTSAPLIANMPVIGTVSASFWATTSARDTDFTVKLVDVHPDGLTNNVVDRVIRARFRLGSKLPPAYVKPNVPYKYTLQVGNTAYIFPPGHELRVEVSSSNFPKFARNLNTTQAGQLQSTFVIAKQTILHDGSYPSYVELPVAPGVTIP